MRAGSRSLRCSLTATALAARHFGATLRVVGKGGKVADRTDPADRHDLVKTSPKANCFGAGTGGSGKSVTIRGADRARGCWRRPRRSTAALRPLLVTDAFDFGLGICGVGGSKVQRQSLLVPEGEPQGPQVSGDAVKLKAGDEVLWDLAPSYPYPNELALEAPETRYAGVPFTVHVFSYDEKGKRKPVAGATVVRAARVDRGRRQRHGDADRARRTRPERHPRQGNPLAAEPRLRRRRLRAESTDVSRGRGTAVARRCSWQRSRSPAAASAPARTSARSS